jgi:Cu(I)/Ag(I) efflux system membrane fusion protein
MNGSNRLMVGAAAAGAVVLLVLAFVLGRASAPAAGGAGTGGSAAPAEATTWYCSMHPQIRQPKPGKCPICAMDLIPLDPTASAGGPRTLVLGESAKALAEIAVAPVERRFAGKTVRMVGKVDYDETRISTIAAWVNGRIDRLYVDYTGTPVRAGDHLVKLYSPELISAQQELIAARAQLDAQSADTSEFMRASNQRALASAREKLRLWGIAVAQIEAIESRGTPEDHLQINAPMGGVVIHKGVHAGMYVKTGAVMYRIADLSHLWVKLEAYESDLAWLRYGQSVAIATEASAGEVFEGTIAFIAPDVDPKTRTVTVRVNVPNPDGRLRPGMFARGQVLARVAQGGRVMDPALSGKWLCPMHPEIVKDANEPCDICGMDLVKAEDLGFAAVAATAKDRPLVVPVTAVLRTGRRAVVYVEVPGAPEPTYEGRTIVLGPRADDVYLVRDGLREGERVVVNGAFKIDSALQIQAKHSMMSEPGGPVRDRPHGSDAARAALAPAYAGYLATHEALAADDHAAGIAAFTSTVAAIDGVNPALFAGRVESRWKEMRGVARSAAAAGAQSADIAAARTAFRDLSSAFFDLEETFGHGGEATHVRVHCPMAFDNAGASWLQTGEDVRNPYFGAAMYACGAIEERMPPQPPARHGPGMHAPHGTGQGK